MPKKVMIFIDGSNMYKNMIQVFKRADLLYYAFSVKLAGEDRELIRTYYYNCPLDQNENPISYKAQQSFFGNLNRTPFLEVRLGRLQKRSDGTRIEKGVDVKLAVDMLSKAAKNQYDTAILISGDADFAEVAHEVKELAKHVELAFFPNQRCYHLTKVCDRCIELNGDFMAELWARK
jgi:uncharacterized LabA/DUF88 family protein